MTSLQSLAVVRAASALLEAVKEAGELSAPGGVMYAALIGKVSLPQFEALMDGLVRLGCVRKSGDLYYYVRSLADAAEARQP